MKKILFFLSFSTAAFGQAGPPYNGAGTRLNTPPQGDEVGIVVRQAPQEIDRIGFTKTLSNSVDSEWGTIVGGIGAGMDVDQTGGNLIVLAGTTARSETIIRSNDSWQGGVRVRARSTLSQRNANNNFFVELVDVIGDGLAYTISSATAITVTFTDSHGFTSENVGQSMYLGLFSGTGTFLSGRYPIASVSGNNITFTVSGFAAGTGTCSAFGWNYYQLHYTGATATVANFDTQRKGYATGVSSPTINTTASPGHIAVITGNDLVATFADQLVASAATIQQTVRATRVENIPDDINLRLQIRIANGSTAPTATTWTIGFVSVSNYANTDVSIQDVRPMGVSTALPVEILRSTTNPVTISSGTVTANIGTGSLATGTNAIGDVGIQYRASATGAGTPTVLNSPATPAVQTVKGTAGRLIGFLLVNSNAATRYLKVFNVVTPTLGTTPATLDIPIPLSSNPVFISFEGGIAFGTAITVAITGGRGTTDNTAITLNDVTGFTIHN
jgi:hypothetical protein